MKKECPYFGKCGACKLLDLPYEKQLEKKKEYVNKTLKGIIEVEDIYGMEEPYYYRNKVHVVLSNELVKTKNDTSKALENDKQNGKKGGNQRRNSRDKNNSKVKKYRTVAGIYEENSHKIVPIEQCLLHNKAAEDIINSIVDIMRKGKFEAYNEDNGRGHLRHILIRTGHISGEILVVLVTGTVEFPGSKNLVKELLKRHPEITTVVHNINDKKTSMVLGDREKVLYGKGYITDTLCGLKFRISPKSFYQINSVQTEVLYGKAMEYAGLTGKETVIDAYSGIGTISLAASKTAGKVIAVELNKAAVKDAITNAKMNGITNTVFYNDDAGKFMERTDKKIDTVFMDPPRSGSDETFLGSVVRLSPKKVVYISCNVETQRRDLEYLIKHGYKVEKACAVDLFANTEHVETVILLRG